MKKYIVFKFYYSLSFKIYERLELSEKELKEYLFKHQTELKNIEVFKKEGKVEIDLDVNINIK